MNYFEIKLDWEKTNDQFYPYKSSLQDKNLTLRINDYPEEPMYTLITDGEIIESFDNWPVGWSR